MTNVVPKQAAAGSRSRRRGAAERSINVADGPTRTSSSSLPQARPRQRSDDMEQMFIDLTRRAPAPAVGPSHWWG